MSIFKTNVTVVGSVTATTVNGIIGLSSNDGDLLANGTADSGTSSYAARVDHVHPGTGGGATTLDGLTDVDTAGVTNGQALIYDSTSTSWKPGTVSSGSSNGDALEVLLNTTGNGGTTYTLSKAVSKVLVAIDGILQNDYTQPNNTTSLVMGFNVDTTETITAWSFTAGAGDVTSVPVGDKFTFVLHVGENATTGNNKTNALICTKSLTISKAYSYAQITPTGSSLIFDINKNGATIWSTQANRLEILSGTSSASQTSFNTTSLVEGDILTIDIDQVGSTTPGGNITVILTCN